MGNRADLKIEISFYGKETIAIMYNSNTRKAIAFGNSKCDPKDKFDPQVGAMIALARMFGDEVEFKSDNEKPLSWVEKDAEANGYTLCRYGYPKKSGRYKVICENGNFRMSLHWSSKHHTFGANDSGTKGEAKSGIDAWMTKGNNPVIAWKRVEWSDGR